MVSHFKDSTCVIDLLNNIDSGFILLDLDKNFINWNHWVDKRCSIDIKDCQNKSFIDIFPELSESRIEEAINSAINLGFPSLVSNIFNRSPFPLYKPANMDNQRIQQSVNVARITLGESLYCLVQINDVTASVTREKTLENQISERKKFEDALVKSENRHRKIMESMIDGLIVFNSNGIIETVNPAARKILNCPEGEIIGQNIVSFIDELLTYSQELDIDTLLSKLNFLETSNECNVIKKDGSKFPVELSISKTPLLDDMYYSAVLRDITERKKIELLKQNFIATVSHELRTPLTSIRGSLGLLAGGIAPGLPDSAQNLIQIADKNSERLLLLINDLLDMEKISSGKLEFKLEYHNVYELVKQATVSNESYAQHYNVEFVLTESPESYNVLVDEHRFQQIMSNLLSNAAKFTGSKGIVEICIKPKEEQVEVSVKDYGPGIPEEFKDNIWNKFSQADTSNTREKGGTGLGLAITKSLCEAMKIDISFTTEPDTGTIFFLHLPIALTD